MISQPKREAGRSEASRPELRLVPEGRIEYCPSIDGMRAIAILVVIGFHFINHRVKGGFLGVDVFFVISGFLISKILVSEMKRHEFSAFRFYTRRARRILPALLLVLSATLLIGSVILMPYEYWRLSHEILASIGFSQNFLLLDRCNYFAPSAHKFVLLNLWSLGIEEQFYLLWPIFLWAVYRYTLRPSHWVAAITGLSLALYLYLQPRFPDTAFYLPFSRLWELSIGAWLSMTAYHCKVRWANSLFALGILLIGAAVFLFSDRMPTPFWGILATSGATLLLFAGEASSLSRQILAHSTMRYIGAISYPLYLWHWPLYSFWRHSFALSHPKARYLLLIFCFILADLTHRLLEKRIQRISNPAHIFRLTLIPAALIAVLALGVSFTQGLPSRFPEQIRAYDAQLQWWWDDPTSNSGCTILGKAHGQICLIANAAKAPTIAIVGDSHALQLHPGLAERLIRRGENLITLGHFSCPPFRTITHLAQGLQRQSCEDLPISLEAIVDRPSIREVWLVANWEKYVGEIPGVWKPMLTDGVDGFNLEENLGGTVAFLLRAGKRVTLFQDPPNLYIDMFGCFRPVFPSTVPCSRPYNGLRPAQHSSRAILNRVAKRFAVDTFDPIPIFCPNGICQGLLPGAGSGPLPLYRQDGSHLSFHGSNVLGDAILSHLNSRPK